MFNNFPISDFYFHSSGSSNLSSSAGSQGSWSELHRERSPGVIERPRTYSFADSLSENLSRDAVKQDFELNGLDSPYDPEEENLNIINDIISGPAFNGGDMGFGHIGGLSGMGPAAPYLRQRSWPEPEATPSLRPATSLQGTSFTTDRGGSETSAVAALLSALPESLVSGLLLAIARDRFDNNKEGLCRFCKNNGERESFYRAHRLRVRGRVACPVLRRYACPRCAATGDRAHTLKYCPLATPAEKIKSQAIMKSRVTSGGSRYSALYAAQNTSHAPLNTSHAPPNTSHSPPTTPQITAEYNLDPLWEALERKLSLNN